MSLNDRCGEAVAILDRHGQIPDDPAIRLLLRDLLDEAAAGVYYHPTLRSVADAIVRANPALADHCWDGEWHQNGLSDYRARGPR